MSFYYLLIVIAALYLAMQQFGILNLLVPSQLAERNMNLGMLFVIGRITSAHCIAMCGGINLSQCISKGEKQLAVLILTPRQSKELNNLKIVWG